MTLSVPQSKLHQVKKKVARIAKRRSASRKQFQSLLGALLNIAKCIAPARLFIGRLLQTIRDSNGRYVNSMKK